MPTEILVVLPAAGTDDVMSITDGQSFTEDTLSINGDYVLDDDLIENGVLSQQPNGVMNKEQYDVISQEPASETTIDKIQESSRIDPDTISVADDPKNTPRTPDSQTNVNGNEKEDDKNDLENAELRLRSARIENLLKQSNRHFLAADVTREIHLSRNHNENGTRVHKQSLTKSKRPRTAPKMQNKFSQTTHEKDCDSLVNEKHDDDSFDGNDSLKGNDRGTEKTKDSRKIPSTRPVSSPANTRQRPVSSTQKPRTLHQVKLAITGTYDVESEHRDIMTKALNSYYLHRYKNKPSSNNNNNNNMNNDEDNDDDENNNNKPDAANRKLSKDNKTPRDIKRLQKILATAASEDTDRQYNNNISLDEEIESPNNSRVQLIYDDDKIVSRIWNNENRPESSGRNSRNSSYSTRQGTTGNCNFVRKQRPVSAMSSQDKLFKLAQCRLIYNDAEKLRKKTRPKSSSWTERGSRSTGNPSGVLVDSVGHVYGTSKPRPWSALPCKFTAFLKEALSNNNNNSSSSNDNSNEIPGALNVVGSYSDLAQDTRASLLRDFNNTKEGGGVNSPRNGRNSSKDNNDYSPFKGDNQVKIVTLQLPAEAMAEQPMPKAVAFNRRNRTTHSWSDSSSMSQSLPNASFLHKQFTTSPPPLKTRGCSPARAGKPSKTKPDRPSSSYSYDGGFFLGAHSSPAEYFVIHPDWVSEALTINRIGGNGSDKTKQHAQLSKLKLPQRRWSERRCMSAPPSKFRNPIAWDDSDAWPYVNKKDSV